MCAWMRDGTVRRWGDNRRGQVGDGTTERNCPSPKGGVTGAVSIGGGDQHTCAVGRGREACAGAAASTARSATG